MAQRVTVEITCDYPGKHQGEVQTVNFGLNGESFAIDLCDSHNKAFDAALQRYAGHARRVVKSSQRQRRTHSNRQRSQEMRAWAASQSIPVSARGRIPADLIAKYEASN